MTVPRQCQLLDLLWMEDGDFRTFIIQNGGIAIARTWIVDRHHIVGGTARHNRVANLIDVAHPIHIEWGHANPLQFRVSCLYRQRQLGRLDWQVMDECFGGRPGRFRGMVESHPLTGVFEKWRMELLS